MLRVVMAGPLPPAIGGMATVIDDISRSSLAQKVDLVLFDTKKRTPEGRSLAAAVKARFAVWRDWLAALGSDGRTIAHIHTCSGLSFFLDGMLVLLARVRGVPAVVHVHGARFDAFLDGLAGPLRALARFLARRASRVVVLSAEWEQKLGQRLPMARLVVIENGVAEIPWASVPKEAGVITVLFLGNLCQRKGVWDLVASAKSLPDFVRTVLVGGEEDPGIADKLRNYLAREKLESKVLLAGPAVGEAKLEWLRRADIFVLPSYAEGVPISMLEALAAGLPAVLTPVGGIPSVLREGEHALFVTPGDQAELSNAIAQLAADAGLRRRLGEAARRHVLERYGIENSARKYFGLYRELKPALVDDAPVRESVGRRG